MSDDAQFFGSEGALGDDPTEDSDVHAAAAASVASAGNYFSQVFSKAKGAIADVLPSKSELEAGFVLVVILALAVAYILHKVA